MTDEISRFAELKPTEPKMTTAERAAVRSAVFDTSAGTATKAGEASAHADTSNNNEIVVVSSNRPTRRPRRAAAVAAAIVAVAGLGAAWGFVTNRTEPVGPTQEPPTSATTTTNDPTSSQSAASSFEYKVSSYEGTDVISPRSINNTGVCFSVQFEDQHSESCVEADVIASGLVWGLYGHPDGGYVLVGVVPDAIDTVEVNGEPADLVGNVWSTLTASTPIELRVGDSTTSQWVTATVGDRLDLPTTTVG